MTKRIRYLRMLSSAGFFWLGLVVVGVVIYCIVGWIVCIRLSRKGKREKSQSSKTFDIPIKDVPEEYHRSSDRPTDSMHIFRLPVKCPHCSAPLKQERIEWVGPAQAECPYCKGVVNAEFEKI